MIIHNKEEVAFLRNSLEALADIRGVNVINVDEIERTVYESLAVKEVSAFDYKFIYASLGAQVDASSELFNKPSVCIHVPDLNSYLYFSNK